MKTETDEAREQIRAQLDRLFAERYVAALTEKPYGTLSPSGKARREKVCAAYNFERDALMGCLESLSRGDA